MTIISGILYWLVSELIAWGLWTITIYKTTIKTMPSMVFAMELEEKLSTYPKTQNRIVEWIRFVIWPYGIIQRTMMIYKIRKQMIAEITYEN